MSKSSVKKTDNGNSRLEGSPKSFPLTRTNFIAMAVAGVLIVAGFLLMLGGSSTEAAFNPDIFSVRRIVIGPGIALAGFVFMGVAIMLKPARK